MISVIGVCKGIENYARYFIGKVFNEMFFCLFDYLGIFEWEFLVIVDESYVSLL